MLDVVGVDGDREPPILRPASGARPPTRLGTRCASFDWCADIGRIPMRLGSGGWIRTSDLLVMSQTDSYFPTPQIGSLNEKQAACSSQATGVQLAPAYRLHWQGRVSPLAVASPLAPAFALGLFYWGNGFNLLHQYLCPWILRVKTPVRMALLHLPVVLIYQALHQVEDQ